MKVYSHLTHLERLHISVLYINGKSISWISKQLCRHETTIRRELKRNQTVYGYDGSQAQRMAANRQACRNHKRRKVTHNLVDLIVTKLKLYWSPEQISGWLYKHDHISISHETIYQFIYREKQRGIKLYKYLRHGGKKYRKKRGSSSSSKIPDRVDIQDRPKIVESKRRLGDWEADTIIGHGHKGVIVSVVDRKSKFVKLLSIKDKKAHRVADAIKTMLVPHKEKVETITFDNGLEFALHKDIAGSLKAKTYFARPYHSWERGLNEHTNGLVRQFLPKNTDFTTLCDNTVAIIENLLNNRPRKVLNFNTPAEVFHA